jgi:hypothetical protein
MDEEEKRDRANPRVHTGMEWRGDEDKGVFWVPLLADHTRRVTVRALIVDQKAAHNVLDIPGSKSERCFIWSRKLTRSMWRDPKTIPWIGIYETGLLNDDTIGLTFEAKYIHPAVAEVFQQAVVVPPLFHAFSNIQKYALTCFCRELGIELEAFFDVMNASFHEHSFHGRPFASGEARRVVSWSERYLRKHGLPGVSKALLNSRLHLMQLLNELQMVVYGKASATTSKPFLLRVHVVARLLAEAMKRCPSHDAPWPKSKLDRDWCRHIYWANLIVALPIFCHRYPHIPLHLIMEEKFEQDFLSRKRFFAAVGGQINLQTMHYKSNERGKRVRNRMEKFALRYSNFRDIWLRADLASIPWVTGLMQEFPEHVNMQSIGGQSYYVFLCGGGNECVTTSVGGAGVSGEDAPHIQIDF